MIAQSLSEALARRGIHYAWVVAGVVFLNAIFGAAALGVPAVLIAPMAADLGLTVGEMSAPQGVRFALFGLVAPFAGGLVLGGAMAAGTLVFIPPAAWVAETFGWRAALLIPTVGTALVLPLVHLLMRERPSDLGLPAYGDDAVRPVPPRLPGNFVQVSVGALALAVRRPVFWVLAGTFAVCGATSLGITQTHLVPFCGDIGISLVAASWLLAVIGVCDLIGTIVSGWLSDRYDNRWLLVWYYGLRGVSLLWLAFGDTTLAGLAIFAIVFGLDYIATVPPTTKLTIAAFGRETGPVVIAWIFAAHQIGAGAMAYGAGLGRDGFGSYLPVFFVAGLLCLVAAATFVLVRRERPALA